MEFSEFQQIQKSKISYETLTEMFGESPTFLASVVNAIGAKSTYTECPDAPYEKFANTGDGMPLVI